MCEHVRGWHQAPGNSIDLCLRLFEYYQSKVLWVLALRASCLIYPP